MCALYPTDLSTPYSGTWMTGHRKVTGVADTITEGVASLYTQANPAGTQRGPSCHTTITALDAVAGAGAETVAHSVVVVGVVEDTEVNLTTMEMVMDTTRKTIPVTGGTRLVNRLAQRGASTTNLHRRPTHGIVQRLLNQYPLPLRTRRRPNQGWAAQDGTPQPR